MAMSSLLKSIECPVCYDIPSSPIYQCSNGHIICSSCLPHLEECVLCREKMPTKPIRSLLGEHLAENMAQLKVSDTDGKGSRDYCRLLGLSDILDCKETISKNEIIEHMKKHLITGVNDNCADITQELEDFKTPQCWFPVYFKAFGEIFFLLCKRDNSGSEVCNLLTSWNCVMAGDIVASRQYFVQLYFSNNLTATKLHSTFPVQNIEDSSGRSAKFPFALPLHQLKQFDTAMTPKTKLKWNIRVLIGTKLIPGPSESQILGDTNVPKVKTSCFAIRNIPSHSNSLLHVFGNANPEVFMDLTFDSKSIGRIIIKLRSDVVPLTSENFRALCTGEKGFGYKGSPIYGFTFKIPKAVGFGFSGGAIKANEGYGGKSIYGGTFRDENFILKNIARGDVYMINGGKANNNSSAFAILVHPLAKWEKRNVTFGKVVEGMEVMDNLVKLVTFFIGQPAKKALVADCGQL